MEQVVSAYRVKTTGEFVIHPMGTFKKYGAYVGSNPCRSFPRDCSATDLGVAVIELLERSGPTGFAIGEIEQYRAATFEKQSELIRKKYFSSIRSTRDSDRRYLQCEVRTEKKSRSWSVNRFAFDAKTRLMVSERKQRVKKSAGAEELGRQLLALLDIPAQ